METLVGQRRVHKKDASIKPRDGIPQPKTRSFKEDKRESKSLGCHFSKQMNGDYDSRDIEFASAVASVAFAIRSQEETDLQYHKKKIERIESQMTKLKGRKDETAAFAPSATRRLPHTGHTLKQLMEQEKNSETGIPLPPSRRSLVPTKADMWERNKMEKIRQRYQKIKSTILDWENQKKMHVKLHMEKKKAELEQQKATFMQYYKDNIVRIDRIAGGARAQLEEKRKYEEKKARETANRIRSTGKLPVTCFCLQYY